MQPAFIDASHTITSTSERMPYTACTPMRVGSTDYQQHYDTTKGTEQYVQVSNNDVRVMSINSPFSSPLPLSSALLHLKSAHVQHRLITVRRQYTYYVQHTLPPLSGHSCLDVVVPAMRQVNNTFPTSTSSDNLNIDNFQLFQCPSTSSASPSSSSPVHSSHLSTVRPLHTDPPSTQQSDYLPPHSTHFASSTTSPRPLLTCNVNETVLVADNQLTPCLGWRLDTRPDDAVLLVTVNNVPLQQAEAGTVGTSVQLGEKRRPAPSLSIDTDEADDTVNALLSSLLTSGLSPNRRFSYPPTSHTLTSLPTQPHLTHTTSTPATTSSTAATTTSTTTGPLRSLSPALMSPSAATTFFQTLDRKRAFKPYYRTPAFTANSVHRVQVTLTLRHSTAASPLRHLPQPQYTAALYAVDPSNANVGLVGYQRLSDSGSRSGSGGGGSMWCWQIGVATCMMMCSLLQREEVADCPDGEVGECRLWSDYFTVQQLLTDKAVSVKGNEWTGRQEVRVEVHSVHTLQVDDQHDRTTLQQYEDECGLLRELMYRTDSSSRRTQQSKSAVYEPVRKLIRAASAREVGEVEVLSGVEWSGAGTRVAVVEQANDSGTWDKWESGSSMYGTGGQS